MESEAKDPCRLAVGHFRDRAHRFQFVSGIGFASKEPAFP